MAAQQTSEQLKNPPWRTDGLIGADNPQLGQSTPRDGRQPDKSQAFYASKVPEAASHPALVYQPTKGSLLSRQLSALAVKQGAVAEPEKRLMDLRFELDSIKGKYDAALADWQTERGVLREFEAESFDIGRLIPLVEKEYNKRLADVVDANGFIEETIRQVKEHMRVVEQFTVKSDKPLPAGCSIDKCNEVIAEAREQIQQRLGHDGATLRLR